MDKELAKPALLLLVLALCLSGASGARAADLTASWNANPSNENVTVYHFAWEQDGTWGSIVDVSAASPLEIVMEDAEPGQYRAKVQAENAAGVSSWTYSIYVTCEIEPPGAPTGLNIILNTGN
jgi:hypothetical protein